MPFISLSKGAFEKGLGRVAMMEDKHLGATKILDGMALQFSHFEGTARSCAPASHVSSSSSLSAWEQEEHKE